MVEKGKLYVVSGPSGVGKNTVIDKAIAGRDDICFSVFLKAMVIPLPLFFCCLILFVRRIRRITAGSLLHSALHSIPGFLPVGILKAVVKLFLEPLHITDDPAQGPVHLWKEDLRQPVHVFSAQGCTGAVQQIREVRQAVSLCAGSDMMCSCFSYVSGLFLFCGFFFDPAMNLMADPLHPSSRFLIPAFK